MQTWKTRSRRVIFDQPRWLKVEYHEVELPDGRIIPDWAWIQTPDYIDVVVETEDGQFLCIRQRKYAVAEPMLAVVGGYIEPGEVPLDTAKRELREETGYVSNEWLDLGHYVVDANRGCATGYIFLARHAYKVYGIDSDDLEEQELLFLSREELDRSLSQGEFKILACATAVSLALRLIP